MQSKVTAANDNGKGQNIEYKVDKMTFLVSPVYNEKTGKTIHDLILNLMKKDSEKP